MRWTCWGGEFAAQPLSLMNRAANLFSGDRAPRRRQPRGFWSAAAAASPPRHRIGERTDDRVQGTVADLRLQTSGLRF